MYMKLKDVETVELVKELVRREGVLSVDLCDYEDVCEINGERYAGPGLKVLIVTD